MYILTVTDQQFSAIGIKHLLEKGVGNQIDSVLLNNFKLTTLSEKRYDLMIINIIDTKNQVLDIFSDAIKKIPTLLYCSVNDYILIKKLYQIGLRGYLSLEKDLQELVIASNTIAKGEIYIDEDFKKYLITDDRNMTGEGLSILSARELQVAKLILNGKNILEICNSLNLKSSTVSTIKGKIFFKMGVKSVIELQKVIGKT